MQDQDIALSSTLRSDLEIFSEDELAHVLVVKSQTLATWRAESKGPDYVKLGKSIFYRKQDVLTWINASVVLTRRTT
jgi:hypothetical protein